VEVMNKKMMGVINGFAILILWFMPFGYIDFMGMNMYQTGQHIGGISYLLLVAGVAIAVLSWIEQYQLCLIVAAAGSLVGLLLAASFGTSVGWGLSTLIGCLIGSGISAYREMRQIKTQIG
jgi:hypothetical protein